MYRYLVYDETLDVSDEFKTMWEVAHYCNYSHTSLGHYFSYEAVKTSFEGHDAQVVTLCRGRYTIIRWRD